MDEGEEKRKVGSFLYFTGAGLFIAVMWGWFLLEQFTSLRVVGASGMAHADPVHILFPVIATPLALVGALILWRRAAGIVANGVPLEATVTAVGGEVQDMRDVSLEYEFEGKQYQNKMSVSSVVANDLSEGGKLGVIVDKRNPARVVLQ